MTILSFNPITGTSETPKVFAAASGEDTSGIFYGYCGAWDYPLVNRGNGWTRAAALLNGTVDTYDPPFTRFHVGTFDDTPAGHVYVHGNMEWGIFGGGSTVNVSFMRLVNAAGDTILTLRGLSPNGMKFSLPDGSGGYTDVLSATNVVPTLGLHAHNVDLKIKNESTIDDHGHTIYPTLISDGIVFTAAGHNEPPKIFFPIEYDLDENIVHPKPMFYGFGVLVVRGSSYNDGTFEVDQVRFSTLDNPLLGTMELTSGVAIATESLTAGVTLLEGPSVSLYLNGALALRWIDPDTATSDIGTLAGVDLMNCDASGSLSWSEVVVANCPAFGCGMAAFGIRGRGVLQEWDGTPDNSVMATDSIWISTTDDGKYSEWTFNDSAVGSIQFVTQPGTGDFVVLTSGTASFPFTFGSGGADIHLGANTTATAAALAGIINGDSLELGVRATTGGNTVNLTAVISGDVGNAITLERHGDSATMPKLNGSTLDLVNLHGGADHLLPAGGYQVGILKADFRAVFNTTAVAAFSGLVFTDQPSDGDTVVVNTLTTTFRDSGAVPQLNEVNIGASVTITANNLLAFLNCFVWPQGTNDVKAVGADGSIALTALTGGTVGNSYRVATSGAQPIPNGSTINVPGTPELGRSGLFIGGQDEPPTTTPAPRAFTFVNGGTFPDTADGVSIEAANRILTYHETWGGRTNEKFEAQGGSRKLPGIGWGVVSA